MSKRKVFHDFYTRDSATRQRLLNEAAAQRATTLSGLLQRSLTAAAADKYAFHGNAQVSAAVVRADLNGYTKWSADKSIQQRVALLDEFFSFVVKELDRFGGVYFRDEGDCVVAVFAPYFDSSYTAKKTKDFCKQVVQRRFGGGEVSAKCVVAFGDIAIYQKAHEVGTDDWSAEGQPFVQAARLEQAVPSRPTVFYFEDEYQLHHQINPDLVSGSQALWMHNTESYQVPGLALAGGWAQVHALDFEG